MSEVSKYVAAEATAIQLTERAREHVLAYMRQQLHCCGIRFSVKKTGCSGFSYCVDYVQVAEMNDIILPFTEHYSIYIDKKSYPYLQGMEVDYVKQGLNAKLVFNNPNQTGMCGCGESFTVE